MEKIFYAIAFIAFVAFILGLVSQKGEAKGLVDGKLAEPGTSYLSATYMSKIFKYVDDVEIRKESDILWHIRSASRVGYSDMGVNRKRVEAIRAAL